MRSLLLYISFFILLFTYCSGQDVYVCPPCDLPCDKLTFDKPGTCPHCKMRLVKEGAADVGADLALNEIKLETGSGYFTVEGGEGKSHRHIEVHYYKPRTFSKMSKILMVIPGAGRDADEYRDDWIDIAEKESVLVLSLLYEEGDYPFEDYHLCGIIEDVNLQSAVEYIEGTNHVVLDEGALDFNINVNSREWIFADFDRIFDEVVAVTHSNQTTYDLFGHSAGGQILHRMALLGQDMKADQIIAANSGFYTLPDLDAKVPFGLRDLSVNEEGLALAFGKSLLVLVGEMDNAEENKGTLLRSESADRQGLHRLARAKYFYEFSKTIADERNLEFRWRYQMVNGVGHDHESMARAAAEILYE